MKLLCLDFGNTNCKYAIFDDQKNIAQGLLPLEDPITTLHSLQQRFGFSAAILSSVIIHDPSINEWLQSHCTQFHELGVHTRTNFSTASIAKPIDIGADRLALCCGAIAQSTAPSYKLVVSVGTCITYNFLSLQNTFLGGAISPGLRLRYNSMHEFTALLPLLKVQDAIIDPPLVGYDTPTNLHSGVIYGTADEINGMIERYRAIYPRMEVYITGGDASYLLPHIKSVIFADPDLLMKGLLWIAYENF